MAYGWPEGTVGEQMNEPHLNERQFVPTAEKKNKPIPIRKKGTSQYTKDVNQMANRIEASTNAATTGEVAAGKNFYFDYNRAGRQIAMGVNPESRISQMSRSEGQATDFAPGAKHNVSMAGPLHEIPSEGPTQTPFDSAVRNSIASIARMSPSQPRGMTWEKNPRAAYELSSKSDEQVDEMVKSKNLSVRQHGMLAHVGGDNIAKANELAKGRATPGDVISLGKKRVKVGSFYENGLNPWGSRNSTNDARSHDIATGKRRGWEDVNPATGKKEDTRKLDAKGRYDMIEHAHQIVADRMGIMPHQVQAISWLADSRDSLGDKKRAVSRKTLQTPVGQEGLSARGGA